MSRQAEPASPEAAYHWGSMTKVVTAVAVMQRMQRSPDGRPFDRGLGWVIRQEKGEEILEHGGGGPGIETFMRLYPKRRLGVVVMRNINGYGAARILSVAADIL